MGIDRAELTQAVTAAGFDVGITREWPGWDHYVAVFMKSGATKPPTRQTLAARGASQLCRSRAFNGALSNRC